MNGRLREPWLRLCFPDSPAFNCNGILPKENRIVSASCSKIIFEARRETDILHSPWRLIFSVLYGMIWGIQEISEREQSFS